MKTIAADELSTLRASCRAMCVITNPVELIAYELDGSLGHGAAHGVVLAAARQKSW